MAKKRNASDNATGNTADADRKERNMADYVFEEHADDGTVTSLGLTMHYPSEAKTVLEYLESKREELGITGKIRICKKIYS
jgi:hypothetical protein